MVKNRPGLGVKTLGELDVDVLSAVWKIESGVTVKDVFEELYESRRLAYTTIMTVMGRLAKKGILKQDKSATPYVYWPLISREELAFSMIDHVADRLFNGSDAFLREYVNCNPEVGKMSTKEKAAQRATFS